MIVCFPPNVTVHLGLVLCIAVSLLAHSSPASNQRKMSSTTQHAYGKTCPYPHPAFGQQMRPVGAAMISPIQSKRSTCSHRHAGREMSRSVWLSVSGQLDGPGVAGVRESTCICVYACEPSTCTCTRQPLCISSVIQLILRVNLFIYLQCRLVGRSLLPRYDFCKAKTK